MNVNDKVKEANKNAVRAAAKAGGNSRWGEAESLAVIEELFNLAISDEEVQVEGFDAIRDCVAAVINPSAFAQRLEKLPEDHPARIVRVKGASRKTLDI